MNIGRRPPKLSRKEQLLGLVCFLIPVGMALVMDLMNIECNPLNVNLLYGGFIVGIFEGVILSHL